MHKCLVTTVLQAVSRIHAKSFHSEINDKQTRPYTNYNYNVKELKRSSFYYHAISVPYKDCYELLYYAGIGNTGLHYITYNDLELPVYCDQEYLGGGRNI